MNDLISIIVPVYNAADYIEQTIEMVMQQSYSKWELILVDDCSTDNSCAVINQYCNDQIKLLTKGKNEGAAKARNSGIAVAKGRYIAFLDADDVWFPSKLEKEVLFMKEKQASFVFCSYEYGDEYAKGTGKVVRVPEILTYKQALSRTVIFTSTVMIDTEKIARDLIHMPDVKSEDSATWWNILRNGHQASGLNETLVIYRRPKHSLSSNKLAAVKRIWNLYRRVEHLSFFYSAYNFVGWAIRTVIRRI